MGFLSTIGSASARAYGFTRSAVAAATDAFFNRVTLLLNTSSTNGAQNNTFLDSSTNNFAITRNGNTTQGTFTPFSQTGWSNNFTSAGLSIPYASALQLQNTNWTIESYFNLSSASAEFCIMGGSNGGGGVPKYFMGGNWSTSFTYNANRATFFTYTGADRWIDVPFTWQVGRWYHMAAVYTHSNTTITLYIDGVSVGSIAYGTGAVTGDILIGRNGEGGGPINGHISNFRYIVGTSLYTSNFTPSTTPLTAITNTQILTCQSNRFVDNSSNGYAIAVTGTPSVQAFSPFAPTAAYDTAVVGGSGYFQRSASNNLTLPVNQFLVGSSDFCMETWLYQFTRTNAGNFWGNQTDRATAAGSSWNIATTATNGYLESTTWVGGTPYNLTSSVAVPLNAWSHVVWCRTGGTQSLFLNGVRVATRSDMGTLSVNNGSTTNAPAIGCNGAGASDFFDGYMSGFKIIIGSGGYDATLSTLTIPTLPPTNTANTRLLTNFTNAGIYDSASKNALETVGNAQVSTTQAKWGTTSMYFDGTGDSLSLPSSSLNLGSGDFTIEAWIYATTTQRDVIVGSISDATGANAWMVMLNNSSPVRFFCRYGGGSTLDYNVGSGSFTTNAWVHLAVTRSGANLRIFVDGTQVGTTNTTLGTSSIDNATANYYVGQTTDGGAYFTGYIDDLRITKGYARYTANFTAPTAAFPLQ